MTHREPAPPRDTTVLPEVAPARPDRTPETPTHSTGRSRPISSICGTVITAPVAAELCK